MQHKANAAIPAPNQASHDKCLSVVTPACLLPTPVRFRPFSTKGGAHLRPLTSNFVQQRLSGSTKTEKIVLPNAMNTTQQLENTDLANVNNTLPVLQLHPNLIARVFSPYRYRSGNTSNSAEIHLTTPKDTFNKKIFRGLPM